MGYLDGKSQVKTLVLVQINSALSKLPNFSVHGAACVVPIIHIVLLREWFCLDNL